jgi:hypothetical protein
VAFGASRIELPTSELADFGVSARCADIKNNKCNWQVSRSFQGLAFFDGNRPSESAIPRGRCN